MNAFSHKVQSTHYTFTEPYTHTHSTKYTLHSTHYTHSTHTHLPYRTHTVHTHSTHTVHTQSTKSTQYTQYTHLTHTQYTQYTLHIYRTVHTQYTHTAHTQCTHTHLPASPSSALVGGLVGGVSPATKSSSVLSLLSSESLSYIGLTYELLWYTLSQNPI